MTKTQGRLHMPGERLTADTETVTRHFIREINHLAPEVQTGEPVYFKEAASIKRQGVLVHRKECDILPGEAGTEQPKIILRSIASPICYDELIFTYDQATDGYTKQEVLADPEMETLPPVITVYDAEPATELDLGRILGVLEFLEKKQVNHSTYTDDDFRRDDVMKEASATAALRHERELRKRTFGEGVYRAIQTASDALVAQAQVRRRRR